MINVFGVEDQRSFVAKMTLFRDEVSVYPVSCEELSGGRGDRKWLLEVLAGGARIVQLRDKKSSDRLLLEKAHFFREKTREAGALFLVNDRVDIAMLAGADGVHVGQGDLPCEEIRRLAPNMIIGLSCNTFDDVQALEMQVQQGICPVSYYNVGPIYPTGTKEGLQHFLGPETIGRFTACCPLPWTVMGGIKFSHIEELAACGVRRVAVVTGISQASDIATETSRWRQKITELSRRASVHDVA